MNKATKRIYMSLLTLILTVIAVGTTTFAWFTLGTIVNLSKVEGSIRGSDGLEFKMTTKDVLNPLLTRSTDWKSTISSADWITLVQEANLDEFQFEALELVTNNLYKLKEVNDGSFMQNTNPTISNADYLEFELEFRSDKGGTLKLDHLAIENSMTSFETDVIFAKIADPINNEFYAKDDNVIIDAGKSLRVTLTSGVQTRTFKKDDSYEDWFQTGQFSYLNAKGLVLRDTNGDVYVESNPDVGELELENYISGVVLDKQDNNKNFEVVFGDKVDGYHRVVINVKVWIDGWDPHTFNAIFEESLSFAIRFRKE